MKICIDQGAPVDGSAYLAEILHAFGLCFAAAGARQQADPARDLLLLPRGADPTGIESFLQAGGFVIAIQPPDSVLRLAGLSRLRETDQPLRLRLTRPLCPAVRGEPLWTLGPAHWYAPRPGPNVIGYLADPTQPTAETVAAIECEVGSGRLVVLAYDPATCIARLRQGDPKRANFIPPGQRTPRATFLQYPHAPADTFWRPTADLHARVFCAIVARLLQCRAPVPTLWHLPDSKPAILLFSGDEDGGTQEANDRQMRDLEAAGGAMSLYVIPDHTTIRREHMAEFTRRGHAISVHPNLVPAASAPPAAQVTLAEQQIRLFQEKFGWPVRTLRNHCYMWPGYLELPALWERLGVGMDGNTTATLYGMSSEYGPYVNVHAAVPLRYVREDGRLIDVFQQPTHLNDDLLAHPTKDYSLKYTAGEFDRVAQRLLDEAIQFHPGPICANFHPCNYVEFSGEHGRVLMRRAQGRGLPIWSLDRWHDWWRARATWRLAGYECAAGQLRFSLRGERCPGLTVRIPWEGGLECWEEVRINGTAAPVKLVADAGGRAVELRLPDEATECRIEARLQSPRSS